MRHAASMSIHVKSIGLLSAALFACASPQPAGTGEERSAGSSQIQSSGPLAGQWHQIGQSFEGRSIEATSYGEGGPRVYVVGGIHGDEGTGLEALPGLRQRLEDPSWTSGCLVRLLRDANPDGSAERTRANARGVDLNRNFPAANFRERQGHGPHALSEPESACLLADLRAFEPDLVVVFHAARQGPFVNFDGPARWAAERFVAAARQVDPRWHVEPDMGYETPGSLGSLLGIDEGLQVLTIEFPRGASGASAAPALEAGLGALLAQLPE